jgi:hypothetical protein
VRKPNCACAALGHPGHGPQWNLTRTVAGRTRAVHLKPGPELDKARRERYHWFRLCGLFVGSGVVEASCKSVIGQRLKQAGMHWTVNGADAIIALRCQQASSTWQEPPCKANSG